MYVHVFMFTQLKGKTMIDLLQFSQLRITKTNRQFDKLGRGQCYSTL